MESGFGAAYLRIDWEFNGDWYRWSAGGQEQAFVECFRTTAEEYRAVSGDFKIEWTANKDGRFDERLAYPGDEWVDVIGFDFYDMYPTYTTQEAWDAAYDSTGAGGSPRGLGTWPAFAREHGKPLAVPEWGVHNDDTNSADSDGGDNAVYIENMHAFFTQNAADIAYKAYFNLQGCTFSLLPESCNPAAAAAYRDRW